MIYSIVSLLGIPLVLAVIGVMTYRKLYRSFFFFFAYLLAVTATEAARHIFLHRPPMQYFYVYWITEAVEVLLAFLVLYEVFLIRLFPGFNITPIYRYLFPIAGLIVVVLTVLLFVSAPSRGPGLLAVIVGEFALALSFFQVAVLVFFCGLVLFMSREWARHDFGIAAGFGVYASVKLIITVVRARHSYAPTAVDQLPTIAYAVAALIWLFYLSRSDPEPPQEIITPQMVDEMDRVHNEVRQLFRRRPKR